MSHRPPSQHHRSHTRTSTAPTPDTDNTFTHTSLHILLFPLPRSPEYVQPQRVITFPLHLRGKLHFSSSLLFCLTCLSGPSPSAAQDSDRYHILNKSKTSFLPSFLPSFFPSFLPLFLSFFLSFFVSFFVSFFLPSFLSLAVSVHDNYNVDKDT